MKISVILYKYLLQEKSLGSTTYSIKHILGRSHVECDFIICDHLKALG